MQRPLLPDSRPCAFLAIALALAFPITAQARVLHVSTTGTDHGSGEPASPFKTIAAALGKAQPGDTVRVHAGVYVGRVVAPVSGAPDKPIVICGERGEKGEWRTVIDSSAPLEVKWQPAPEIGDGVYKTPLPGYEPRQMLVDGKFIPRIWQDHMADGSVFEALAFPPDHVIKTDYYKQEIKYWDTMGAMFGTRDGFVYLRFRDRDDPNEKALRAAPAGGGVHVENQSHLVLRDLMVRGGENCVLITGPKAAHNVVERCRLLNGAKRIRLTNGASHNTIRENEMSIEFYAETCQTGAWGYSPKDGKVPYELRLKQQFYRFYKLFCGPNSTSDYGVRLYRAGPGNEVCHNHVYRGGQGISVHHARDVRVHHNTVHGFSSIGIICTLNHVQNVQIYENVVYNSNINLRIHHVNERNQTIPRSLYVYRNRFWNKPGVGSHVYFHYNKQPVIPEDGHARIYIYHNVFAGAGRGLSVSGWADDLGGLRETVVVNNVFSTDVSLWAAQTFIAGQEMMGVVDYNWLGGRFKTSHPGHDYTKASWYGEHNTFEKGAALWEASEMPDFELPPESSARRNELDLSFGVKGLSRFRANIFMQRGAIAGAFRTIPFQILTWQELGLPSVVADLARMPRGLVLVTGPTGSGKTTTLASLIELINSERNYHIVTVEDPIEFLHAHKNSLVNQREVGSDTDSFAAAMKYVLRQDPDVVLIGEIRDLETLEAALRVAETGHLVFATLHTNNAVQTIHRIVDMFPPYQQEQIRSQLSFVLVGVVSQQLIARSSGVGRALVLEIMLPNTAIRSMIREDKIHQIYGAMQVGQKKFGMQTFNQSLYSLYAKGLVTREEAMSRSSDLDELRQMMDGERSQSAAVKYT